MDDKNSRETYAHGSNELVSPSLGSNPNETEQSNNVGCSSFSTEQKPKRQPMTRAEIINACLTAAIFLATAGSGYIFYKQWKEMQSASGQTAQIIQKSGEQVDATNKLAEAAKKANENAVLSDRAWMGIIFNIPPFDPSNPNKSGTIIVSAINSGRSPALIKLFHSQEYAYKRFPKNPIYVPLATKASESLVVPNTQVQNKFSTSTFNPATVEAIKGGNLVLYVYTEVEYINVRTNTEHVTRSCMYWLPSASDFQSCPEYQYAN
jgi:hypothetical protein